ncbi:outer membrane beta-barrel protein [Novosphingobium lindaniclasticum]
MNFYKYGLVAAALLAQPALADETKLSGLRAEARVGWETPTVSDGDVYKLGQSVSFGGEIGYDLPVSTKVTVGPYVNYEYARSKECDSGLCLGSAGNFAAGGRIGLNLGTRSQLYAKVGYDRMKLKATFDGTPTPKRLTASRARSASTTIFPPPLMSASNSTMPISAALKA